MIFQISRCRAEDLEPGDLECAPDDEIEEFISRLFIETWTNYLVIDFQIHGDTPVVRNEKWLRADIIEKDYLITNIYRIRQHEIETEDAYL